MGAGLLAMDVNDNAYYLNKRADLESIASKLAPTIGACPREDDLAGTEDIGSDPYRVTAQPKSVPKTLKGWNNA